MSIALAAIMTLATPVAAQADTLVIENVDQAAATTGVRPNRGMSMETVESRWGAPLTKRGAVGDPPITRWEYPSFVVYFEYRNVIHAVKTDL
ncbi:MAG: hypothetical protein KJO13_04480 [Gammaproteobacteria bacterium]|nr:hypothetical protein [Gammaproteobacteria bacterium]